jgi:hypothetical protein
MWRYLKATCLIIFLSGNAIAQVVFEPYKNTVYDYLDEMAAEGYIRINTFARPFARTFIASQLDSLQAHREALNKRQQEQLDFFMRDYGKELQVGRNWDRRPDLLYRSDSVFALTVNPILGGSLMANSNGTLVHTRIGAEFFASAGKVGMYGSIRDNTVSQTLSLPVHLTPLEGQNYKTFENEGRNDYNEAIGGISYQWRWGDISLVKDRYKWGNTQRHANIFSGRAPSYAFLYLRIYPWQWLDSARSYLTPVGTRKVMTNKNLAANFVTIKTKWNMDFTVGNSIIYSDDGLQPAYFIPFMFFKSVDHTYSGTGSNELGQNSQLYFDVSIRSIRKVHFFASLFMDELNIGNMWDAENHTNIWSMKAGATWFNALPNVHLTAEYTRTAPWTYRHQIASTTFASNEYNLGHYMGENADELYMAASWRPWRTLSAKAGVWISRKGPEHEYEIIQGNANVTGLTFLETVAWEQQGARLDVEWEVVNGSVLFMSGSWQRSKGLEIYVPDFLSGNIVSVEAGFRVGW